MASEVPETVVAAVARDLSLGLDCNVSLMACEEAIEVLFRELRELGWRIQPPDA